MSGFSTKAKLCKRYLDVCSSRSALMFFVPIRMFEFDTFLMCPKCGALLSSGMNPSNFLQKTFRL